MHEKFPKQVNIILKIKPRILFFGYCACHLKCILKCFSSYVGKRKFRNYIWRMVYGQVLLLTCLQMKLQCSEEACKQQFHKPFSVALIIQRLCNYKNKTINVYYDCNFLKKSVKLGAYTLPKDYQQSVLYVQPVCT